MQGPHRSLRGGGACEKTRRRRRTLDEEDGPAGGLSRRLPCSCTVVPELVVQRSGLGCIVQNMHGLYE